MVGCLIRFRRGIISGTDSNGLIRTTVLAAGVIYGYGENTLHWMFKQAWLTSSAVPVLGTGDACVPTIHARDLCQVVQAVCAGPPLRNAYLIAVDGGRVTVGQIAEAISQGMSDGTVERREPDELLMAKTITPWQYDTLLADLVLEPTTVRDVMRLKWLAPTGLVSAMPRLVEEYKALRNLHPMKLAVFGPPFSGNRIMRSIIVSISRKRHTIISG